MAGKRTSVVRSTSRTVTYYLVGFIEFVQYCDPPINKDKHIDMDKVPASKEDQLKADIQSSIKKFDNMKL